MQVERGERADFVENVAGWDAGLRVLAAACILLATLGSLHFFSIDWVLTILLHPLILTLYLLATAVSRMDPMYHGFGWRTLRDPATVRDGRRLRSRRSRGLRRTSP